MENSSQLILEISSDEESGFGEPRKAGGHGVGGGGFGYMDDCDWLSELLGEVGGDNKGGDSDDVVLVSEFFANPPKKSRSEFLKPSTKVVDDDDDDCIVLDGDPEKSVVAAAAANCRVGDSGDDDDDDVEIVGEKGEVACRDFPHARHLCVKLLFASTPHSTHCSQCHCYVCDSLAPCSHWGTGVSSIDHCHATDKDEYWKIERIRKKNSEKPVPAVNPSSIHNTSQPAVVPSSIHNASQPALIPSSIHNTSHLHKKNSDKPAPAVVFNSIHNTSHLRAYNQPTTQAPPITSQSSKIRNPYNQPTTQAPPITSQSSKIRNLYNQPTTQAPPITSQSSKIRNPYNQPTTQAPPITSQSSNIRSPIPQSPIFCPGTTHLSSGTNTARPIPVIRAPRSQFSHILKRNGKDGASSLNNSRLHGPQLPTNSLKRCHMLQTPVSAHNRVLGTRTVLPVQQDSSPQDVNNVGRANYLQTQPHFQPYVNTTNFVSTVAPLQQPHVASQPSVFRPKTYAPSRNSIGSGMNSGCTIPSNPISGNNNLENRSSLPQERGNPNSSLSDMLGGFQKVNNHAQNGTYANTNDYSLAWDYSSLIPGNVQVQDAVDQGQSAGPVDNSQVKSVVEPVVYNNYQKQGVDSSGGCQFPESIPNGAFDFLFDNLMFENNLLPEVSEVPVSPLWNVYSPEPASLDTGNLFDF